MKKIINGKVYNTETASRVGAYESGFQGDIDYVCEELYRKKNGEFFVYAEGGAATSYAASRGADGYASGEAIKPMTYDEAAQWAERHLTGEQYEQIFGEVSEDDTTVKTMISTTAAEIEIIKRNAAKSGMTVSAYIVMKCAE